MVIDEFFKFCKEKYPKVYKMLDEEIVFLEYYDNIFVVNWHAYMDKYINEKDIREIEAALIDFCQQHKKEIKSAYILDACIWDQSNENIEKEIQALRERIIDAIRNYLIDCDVDSIDVVVSVIDPIGYPPNEVTVYKVSDADEKILFHVSDYDKPIEASMFSTDDILSVYREIMRIHI